MYTTCRGTFDRVTSEFTLVCELVIITIPPICYICNSTYSYYESDKKICFDYNFIIHQLFYGTNKRTTFILD